MVAFLVWVGAYFLLEAAKERGCPPYAGTVDAPVEDGRSSACPRPELGVDTLRRAERGSLLASVVSTSGMTLRPSDYALVSSREEVEWWSLEPVDRRIWTGIY